MATTQRNGRNKNRQNVYFSEATLEQVRQEAERLDRPVSWVLQRAWKIALPKIRQMKSEDDGSR